MCVISNTRPAAPYFARSFPCGGEEHKNDFVSLPTVLPLASALMPLTTFRGKAQCERILTATVDNSKSYNPDPNRNPNVSNQKWSL